MFGVISENPIYLVIIALIGAMIFVAKINEKFFASFKLIYVRGLMSITLYSLAGGVALKLFLPEHSLLLRSSIAFLVCFLIQTVFYWIIISLEYDGDSASTMFLKFKESVISWSAQKRHIELKSQMEREGFKQSGAFETSLDEDISSAMYLFSFDSTDNLTRMLITFLPIGNASYMMSSVESLLKDGTKIITESGCVFTGLLEPTNCDIKQVAFQTNPLKLLKIHKRRLAKKTIEQIQVEPDILSDINKTVDDSVATNIKYGVINPPSLWNEYGLLTSDGKYRMWSAMIRSYYFPF